MSDRIRKEVRQLLNHWAILNYDGLLPLFQRPAVLIASEQQDSQDRLLDTLWMSVSGPGHSAH